MKFAERMQVYDASIARVEGEAKAMRYLALYLLEMYAEHLLGGKTYTSSIVPTSFADKYVTLEEEGVKLHFRYFSQFIVYPINTPPEPSVPSTFSERMKLYKKAIARTEDSVERGMRNLALFLFEMYPEKLVHGRCYDMGHEFPEEFMGRHVDLMEHGVCVWFTDDPTHIQCSVLSFPSLNKK
jgi:hypothetical protein